MNTKYNKKYLTQNCSPTGLMISSVTLTEYGVDNKYITAFDTSSGVKGRELE